MTISTRADLEIAIRAWMARADSSDPAVQHVDNFISLAESRIARDPRLRLIQNQRQTTISAVDQRMVAPTNLLAVERLRQLSASVEPLRYLPPTDFWSRDVAFVAGAPRFYTIEGDADQEALVFVLAPYPTSSTSFSLLYYRQWPSLAVSTSSNWLLVNQPGIYLYAALIEAAIFISDDAAAVRYATLFDQLADTLSSAHSANNIVAGGALNILPEVAV